MADSTLTAIRTKVRRLVRAPSVQTLPDATLDDYINTFVLYDFPENLRLFSLRRTFTFYTSAYVDTYETTTTDADDPFFQFKDRYITVHDPVYVAGYQSQFSQSREQFFGIWPFFNSIQQIALGDGVTTLYTGTLGPVPILRNNVTFSSIDINNNGIAVADSPVTNTTGNLIIKTGAGLGNIIGTINYVTGAYTITFIEVPGAGQAINAETVPYSPSRPLSVLYFNNVFTCRPVPDESYPINVEVYVRPTELLAADQSPELQQWWQYIAFGAAKKIFEDRTDMDSVQLIMPAFKEQEALVLRTTLVQQGDSRASTIYSQQTGLGAAPWGFGTGWW